MANITLSVPNEVKREMENYDEVKWSEVAKKAIIEKVNQLRKLEILRKYLEKEPFNQSDIAWMDENDWHPVDERGMNRKFVQETEAVRKQKTRKTSINELFE